MKDKRDVFAKLKGKLVVSCQALEEEPLHSSYIMGRMALAAALGGAAGIRANGVSDIKEIKKNVDLPIIGIIKSVHDKSDVFITPTMEDIDALHREGVEIIAIDATRRIRPDGKTISEVFPDIREKYKDQIFMADCSTFEEAEEAYRLGFDCIGTTLRGYTEYTKDEKIPDLELTEKLVKSFDIPIIAEGGIWTVEDLQNVYKLGAYTAVVGTAITRPMDITRRFVNAIENQ